MDDSSRLGGGEGKEGRKEGRREGRGKAGER
jgi:hypothetical protein